MNEIVKIHNDLTNEKLGKMSAKELDLFMCICHKMRDKGTERIVIGFDELRRLGNYNKNSNLELKKELIRANDRLLEFKILIEQGSKTKQRTLFKEFETDMDTLTVTCEVWEETAYILNSIASFTRFDLKEFVSLDSKYAKRLYKLLKQYRTQGVYYTSKDDFYKALDVPKSLHRACNFNNKALYPALDECKRYIPSLKCVPKKSGRGGAIQGYIFTFDKEIPLNPPKKESKSMSDAGSNKASGYGFQKQKAINKFNQFQQNDYDFEQLERDLVQN